MIDQAPPGVGLKPDSRSLLSRMLIRSRRLIRGLISAPLTVLATLIVIGFVLLALFGEQVAPYAYDANAFSDDNLSRFQKPDCSLGELVKSYVTDDECLTPFGTDNLGQDIYSRVILGSREIFRLAGIGTLVAVIVGSMVGLLIGYYGGLVDEVVGRLLDSFMSIPVLLLALVLFGALGDADNGILIVLIIVYSPIVARVVRSNVLELRTRGFVEAARLRGESTWYILGREILPSVLPALVVEASLRFSYAIFLVASLGFLGLGADPPTPNWGLMVFEPYDSGSYRLASWTITYPAAAIAVLVVSVNIMSDGIKRIVQRS